MISTADAITGRHPESKAKLRNTKRLHAPLTDNPHKNKKIESKWNVRKWLKSSHFIRRKATKKALRRKREKLRRKSCKMMMKNKTRTLCLLLMLFILRHLTSQGVEILSFSAFVFAGVQSRRTYIFCTTQAKKEKPRRKWHVHTHLIVMNYDKFFYGKRVFHFVCGDENLTHWRVTAWTEGERRGREREKGKFSIFLFMFGSSENSIFLGT